MSWLHTWTGLFCGWLLCAIFFTGTLSVFREPITRWMTAEPTLPAVASVHLTPLELALRYLESAGSGARFWRIELPAHEGGAMTVAWAGRGGVEELKLHPGNGEVLPQPWGRDTQGGRHFMSFHYTLHLPVLGYWLVGLVSIGMLVALLTGVIIHRRIFQDFFLFRPGKGLRTWMDAHNVSAVLTLPFLFMIVYTGLAVFYLSYMPWPLQTLFGDYGYSRYQAALHGDAPASGPRFDGLPAMVAGTESLTRQRASMVLIEFPDRVRVFGTVDPGKPALTLGNPMAIASFAGGQLVKLNTPHDPMHAEAVHGVMESLHLTRFAGWGLKWLYFLSDLLGTLMLACGNVMFLSKRARKSQHEFGPATPRFYRLTAALNAATMAGICLASIAYFYANRLIPASLPGRADWEIRVFLLVWLAALLHALCRPAERVWHEQLSLTAVLCLGLPLLNYVSTGQHLGLYLAGGDGQRAAVELISLAFAVVLGGLALRLRRSTS
ncbi:PepSY-associated TM helix domain-containing protein [Bordetella holmesii]|nr:PepSY-associated TM helix domain-containing protein [Bordetella holmesii]AHV93279.1 pepSY-associated TM helix family protein [Bordetella holmesii ATCC 51541]AIT26292.1 pepSY-associated TM helix family protein [Bordetella holmesii 44057]AMD47290.1 peptidase [Bordetella holmesii H558]EWM42241.1 pepSY-associated TM helix family protein [Bordetella holmesii 41130]EWM46865.1 pepSY-associated TM helix family protein [Bordetella holmesii 35009]EWM51038.1 pepSY-associated TM helix family protein [